ncbi:cytochrome c3 family protein [Oscillatoria sp. CS-180]|nr:cytochrome c3 family protein [Oscillatoria sp. CS-180]
MSRVLRFASAGWRNPRQARRAIAALVMAMLLLLGWATPAWGSGVDPAKLDESTQLWQTSAHALNNVNCSSCHQADDTKAFVAQPGIESCQSCHEQSVDTFLLGKHGIRQLEGASPLTPAMARLPMQVAAHDVQMNCSTCHDVHSVNTVQAAVDSCLGCHSDTHSLNYPNSRHAELFAADRSLPRPSAASVSCATCHLPRHELKVGSDRVTQVNHNNTYTLLPRDRMVQEVCMNCHGVEYSYNSIFDDDLVEANFDAPPALSLETFDLVRALEVRRTDQEGS